MITLLNLHVFWDVSIIDKTTLFFHNMPKKKSGRLSDCYLLCFINVDMRWMLITLSWGSYLWLLSSMHLLNIFYPKHSSNLAQFSSIQTGLLWFHLLLTVYDFVWPCKWISTFDTLCKAFCLWNICKTSCSNPLVSSQHAYHKTLRMGFICQPYVFFFVIDLPTTRILSAEVKH